MNNIILKYFPFKLKYDEEIKQIKEFPDYYISNYGNVFVYKNNKFNKVNFSIDKNGRLMVHIKTTDKRTTIMVGRLVAQNFIQDITRNQVISYKDGNVKNNFYKNIIIMSKSENSLLFNINKKHNIYKQIDNNTIQGTISNGKTFIIDKDDYDKVYPYCWYQHKDGYLRTLYEWYKDENNKRHNKYILMHNLIKEKREGLELDHLDRNPTNNKKENLIYKTHAENMNNLAKYNKDGTMKGTYYSKKEKKWKAHFSYNKVKYHLGTFNTQEEAEKSLIRARKELNIERK